MLRGIYAAATGLEANLINQEVATENLAHSNVPGYRRRGAIFETFETFLAQQPGPRAAAPQLAQGPQGNVPQQAPLVTTGELWGTRPSFVYTDFQPGALSYTGNPFDVGAADTTFFVVDGPNGPLLTRNGAFMLNDQRELVTRSGLRVRGEGGRIVVPPETALLTFGQEGSVIADGVEVGRMLLANVPNPTALIRVGNTLFQGPLPNGQPIPGTVRIEQGYLEQPNSNVVQDMVTMINGLRHYEAAQRALRSLSDAVGQNTRPQG